MTDASDRRLTPECRAVLRGADLAPHVAGCVFCQAWLRRRSGLQDLLREPVEPLGELEAARVLTGIRERLVEQIERGPVGRLLENEMPVAPLAEEEGFRVDPLLVSELAERVAPVSGPELAERDWSRVRAAVLEDIAAHREVSAGRFRTAFGRRGALAAVGLAAAVLLSVLLLRGREPEPVRPRIVFADIPSLPDLPYSPMSVLRSGGSPEGD